MRVLLMDTPGAAPRAGARELIDEWRASETATIWVDADDVSDAERTEVLRDCFGLHPLAIEDAMRQRHPPKLETFKDHYFLMLRGLNATTEGLNFGVIQISMFVGERFLLTRRTGRSINTDALWTEVAGHASKLADPRALALELAGRVVRRYVPLLISIEPRLELMEKDIFEKPNDDLLMELSQYKSKLTQLRRIFNYHEHVIERLHRLSAKRFPSDDQHTVVDILDQAKRSGSLADLYYSLVDDLQNAYISLASHRLNQVMRVLTVITVIFVPLSFLAGVYGMNFEQMPELKLPFGYYALLGVMGFVVAVQLVFFKIRGWL